MIKNHENRQSILDYKDVVVQVSKIMPLAAAREKWNKVSVVVSPADEGMRFADEGQEVNLATFAFDSYVHSLELSELPKLDVVVRMFSYDEAKLEQLLSYAQSYGSSVVFLSNVSDEVVSSLPQTPLLTWLTCAHTEIDQDYIRFAAKNDQGVMLDAAREGKLLYALVQLLSKNNAIMHTHQIINNSFSGISLLGDAKQLEEYGLSYWMNTNQQTYPDGLFMGKNQAFRLYYDLLITHRLSQAVASYIQGGRVMGDLLGLQNAMHSVGANFANQLNPDITQFKVPSLADITAAQRLSGSVPIEAIYEVLGEIRRVELELRESE